MVKKDIPIKYCIQCSNPIPRITKDEPKRYRPATYIKMKFCSLKCKGLWQKTNLKGENNPNYRHGETSINEVLRGSPEYRKWRISVFKRDNFTCQHCVKVGGYINAHHILPFSKYPEARFDIKNGVTLCEDCHSLADKYYYK